jgi:hypothetical protein
MVPRTIYFKNINLFRISTLYNDDSIILEMSKLARCHHCGEEKENCYHGYIAMTIPIPEAEADKQKWGGKDWWKNLERENLAKSDKISSLALELDKKSKLIETLTAEKATLASSQ